MRRLFSRPAGWVAHLSPWLMGSLLLGSSACDGQLAPSAQSDAEKRAALEALYRADQERFPDVDEISAQDLRERLQAGDSLVLVDVREPAEQAVSTLPGAVPFEEFEARLEDFVGREIVTYCTIGYRSGLAAQQLAKEGWRVQNLAGSLLAWTHAGGELVDPQGEPTRRLHVYGERWDLAAEGYITEW